jgi:hypothetical protein
MTSSVWVSDQVFTATSTDAGVRGKLVLTF